MAAPPSPFMGRLDTNWIPSRVDRRQIQYFLERPRVQLAELNKEVVDLQAKLDELTAERNQLQRLVHDHYSLLSPMRGLPDDLLREIFLFCLPADHKAVMSVSQAPLVLGRVCARWRAIAYRTPRLWASIHIPIPTPPAQVLTPYPLHIATTVKAEFAAKIEHHCNFIDQWLSRSGSCPISFSFHPREHTLASISNSPVQRYFNLLLKFLPRWGNVEMTIPIGGVSTILAALRPEEVPKLYALDLRFTRRHPADEDWKTGGLLRAPNLKWMRIVCFPLTFPQTHIEWSNIQQLIISEGGGHARVRRISMSEAYHILSKCPRLRECSLDIFSPFNGNLPQGDVIISLPELDTLTINDGTTCLGLLFENLDVPSLRFITYHASYVPSYQRRSALSVLMARTHGTVESLTTDIGFFTRSDLVDAFESAPCIKSITSKRSRLAVPREQSRLRSYLPLPFATVFLRLLTTSKDQDVYLPRLESLTFGDAITVSDDDVIDFVQSRNGSDAPEGVQKLKKLAIKFAQEQNGDIEAELGSFVSEGLVLELEYWERRQMANVHAFSPWNGVNRWGV